MFSLKYRAELDHEESRVMGLLSGESCMTDRQTSDGRTTWLPPKNAN